MPENRPCRRRTDGPVARGMPTTFQSKILVFALLTLFPSWGAAEDQASFLRSHCVSCHGPNQPKADLRLDALQWRPTDEANVVVWQELVDRVAAAEMPPKNHAQPTAVERDAFLKMMRGRIRQAVKHSGREVVLRRLNRAQFRNTLRDLLHLDFTVSDPTEAFPADDEDEGFDNLGETLQMSDFLLRQYLKVARSVVDRASFAGERPGAVTYQLKEQGKTRPLNFRVNANDPERDYVVLTRNDERAPGDPRGQSLINCREGATHDGYYDFTFEVESKGRGNLAAAFSAQKRNDYPIYRPEDLHRFEIYITAPSKSSNVQTRPRTLVHAVDLPDNRRVLVRKRIWLPKAWRVEVGFGNGYWGVVDPILLVDPEFDFDTFRELPKREQNERYGKLLLDRMEQVDAPRINIYVATESGPHYDTWPPASHTAVYGKQGEDLEEHLLAFATRAFRRPVTAEQIAPYVTLAKESPEGVRTAIEAILCSPRFVYLKETPEVLDDHAVASRLSYFLWNSMPDQALIDDANQGRLREAGRLRAHVDRMLADRRSDEFVQSFVWAWLKLQNTVDMAPDPTKFYEFHRNRLNEAMIAETNTFFRVMLTENLPLSTFVDSDFAVINADLARHYGLAGKVNTTAAFQRVTLPKQSQRGGLLGQTAVLTASANGVDTSPVVRGIWILDNLLGAPPAPPPPDVEIPEPDARGDLTIRELYAKHRTVDSCNNCHQKIDPLGFALETYDAIGAWRTQYASGHVVDASGMLPNGKRFEDVAGLKRLMQEELDPFSRNLTRKLMTYATGRRMSIADRAEIDAIMQRMKSERGGLRDLVKHVVTSEVFLTK